MLPSPSQMPTPSARAMQMMAYTLDSSPELVPERTTVAGPVRVASAISRTGAVSVDVKYSVRRLSTCARTGTGRAAPKHFQRAADNAGAELLPAGVELVVADVAERDDGGAHHGQQAGGDEAAVDRGHRRLVLVGRPDGEHAADRREHADGPGGQREDQPERRIEADRLERRDAEDDRRHQGDLVALEEVGGHAGAVADVVAHVVGDGGRVAGVVLGDARLDLAHEVGADVGRLGEDAATDSQEQREQRATEAEPDEDGGRGVLEDHDDQRRPEETE